MGGDVQIYVVYVWESKNVYLCHFKQARYSSDPVSEGSLEKRVCYCEASKTSNIKFYFILGEENKLIQMQGIKNILIPSYHISKTLRDFFEYKSRAKQMSTLYSGKDIGRTVAVAMM